MCAWVGGRVSLVEMDTQTAIILVLNLGCVRFKQNDPRRRRCRVFPINARTAGGIGPHKGGVNREC